MRTVLSIAMVTALALAAPAALAQDNPPAAGASGSVEATVAPPKVVAPRAAVEAAATKEDEPPDHEKFVGRFGVGYLGLTNLPLGAGADGTGITKDTVPAPIIGVRYWLTKMIGIDGGIGFAFASSSTTGVANNTTTSVDGPSIFGLALHGGVPLALAGGKHYTFEIIPEVNVGFTSRTDKSAVPNNPPPDVHHSGFRLDVGARVGTEIHFGFIGIPELSLQATVGLAFSHQAWKNSQDSGATGPAPCQANGCSASIQQTGLGTSVQSDPWALFVNNVSALYYF